MEVVRPIKSRVGAPVAATCYIDNSPPPVIREIAPGMAVVRGEGGPSKRLRRELDRMRRARTRLRTQARATRHAARPAPPQPWGTFRRCGNIVAMTTTDDGSDYANFTNALVADFEPTAERQRRDRSWAETSSCSRRRAREAENPDSHRWPIPATATRS